MQHFYFLNNNLLCKLFCFGLLHNSFCCNPTTKMHPTILCEILCNSQNNNLFNKYNNRIEVTLCLIEICCDLFNYRKNKKPVKGHDFILFIFAIPL